MPPKNEDAKRTSNTSGNQVSLINTAFQAASRDSSTSNSSTSLFLFYGMAGAVGLLTMASLPFLVVPMLKGNALPYMNIPVVKYKNLFDKILPRHIYHGRPKRALPHRFIDLGHGFGEAVVSAAQRGYFAAGVELNPTLYLLSVWNVWRHRLWWPFDTRVRLVCGDMWKRDLRFGEQDVILMFGVQSLMAQLTAKVLAEAKDGALVVLYRFQLTLPASSPSLSPSSPLSLAVAEERVGAECKSGTVSNNTKAEIELLEVSEDEFSVYRVLRPVSWIREEGMVENANNDSSSSSRSRKRK